VHNGNAVISPESAKFGNLVAHPRRGGRLVGPAHHKRTCIHECLREIVGKGSTAHVRLVEINGETTVLLWRAKAFQKPLNAPHETAVAAVVGQERVEFCVSHSRTTRLARRG
jgi:hypothetical protein